MSGRLLESARHTLAPLASPSALSWTVILVFCPVLFLVQVPGNAIARGGPFGEWVLAFLIGFALLAAGILAARWATTRHGAPRVGAVLWIYAAATVVQAIVFGLSATALGATSDPQISFRLMAPLVNGTLLLVVGVAVASHAAHRRVIAELEHKRARLLAMGPSLETELDRLQGELAAAVHESLDPALASLDAALAHAAGGGRTDATLDALDAIVEEHVRPISRDLLASNPRPDVDGLAVVARVPTKVPLPRTFVLARGVRPAVAALALAIGLVPTTVRDLDPVQGLVFLLTAPLVCWVVLVIARYAMGVRAVRTPIGIAVVVLVHVLAMGAAIVVVRTADIAMPTAIAGSALVFLGALGAFVVGAILVGERRADSEAALVEATERLERAVAITLRRQRLVRRRLAFVLHGSLQGALYSAALRVGEGAQLDQALVEQIRSDVLAAMALLDAPRSVGGACRVRVALDDLATVWRGRRSVITRVAPDVDAALRHDADADEAVAEVVREAVNNAFRHGAATTVEVAVEPRAHVAGSPPCAITICVRDDGTGEASEGTPGTGSALLDDLCTTWARSGGRDGSILRAEVALADADRVSPGPDRVASA